MLKLLICFHLNYSKRRTDSGKKYSLDQDCSAHHAACSTKDFWNVLHHSFNIQKEREEKVCLALVFLFAPLIDGTVTGNERDRGVLDSGYLSRRKLLVGGPDTKTGKEGTSDQGSRLEKCQVVRNVIISQGRVQRFCLLHKNIYNSLPFKR